MHAQEVLAPKEHASSEMRVKLHFIRKKFQTQEGQNPIRKKPQEDTSLSQGSYGSWKTWKVLELYHGIFQDWKVLEKGHWSWKVLEIC